METFDVDKSKMDVIQSGFDKLRLTMGLSQNEFLYNIMKNLSMPCEDLIQKCSWMNANLSCTKLFRLQTTYEGFCCHFDIGMIDQLYDKHTIVTAQHVGWNSGLEIRIDNKPNDYFYSLLALTGIKVHIYNKKDFPDAISGKLVERVVSLGTEMFLEVSVKTFYSVPEVHKYSIRMRKCIFKDEATTQFHQYSLSNCLLECRVKRISDLCGCIPFLFPIFHNFTYCTLSDMACVIKHREKWTKLYSTQYTGGGLNKQMKSELLCPNCLPSCSSTHFSVSTLSGPLHSTFLDRNNNMSIFRVYFRSKYSTHFKQDVITHWFELISNIGGLMGIFMGISIVSVIEFLYFISVRFVLNLTKNGKR